ncbi:MAG: HIT domain-containing protein [Planctomycetia bacterium]|uniref:HIT family hydrolase n=1 Tax=Candidatus Brocadia sapporoensis TaxID=392547 RepID=A0A1V6M2X3_9BACT|nr:HIT domain-containing protein [Candidatus Brocadia sapporoensis]MCC7238451.1 HIT domain-containing protein [Candidatus Brocadia sp.]QOJ05529.1 MAG: HIT domain-containing protein [Planctomycetia bacterium]TVL98547.1 MAG: HIT domain-containing protein [Candidatus Brocadia sp. BL1]MDG6006084.1 HIT domain-containing protein [Candidatus Brocadia sp.]OQD46727.1 HIT family hydrolase [Candidatus Brocadia sapporoensis]
MKNLWAPWRITYIQEHPKDNGCFLCNSFLDNHDEKHLIVVRRKECFCILNKYPYNSGHLMIVPNQHKPDISDLTDHEMLEIMRLTRDMKKLLATMMNPDGFNLGVNLGKSAGAGLVGHFHLHIVPRWDGDTNFMPVISDTKVIPQSLEDIYREFKKHV